MKIDLNSFITIDFVLKMRGKWELIHGKLANRVEDHESKN